MYEFQNIFKFGLEIKLVQNQADPSWIIISYPYIYKILKMMEIQSENHKNVVERVLDLVKYLPYKEHKFYWLSLKFTD